MAGPPQLPVTPSNPIAGFWLRALALLIDSLILGAAGFVLGLIFFDYFCSIGSWGRLYGFVITLLYLGLMNSSLRNGQTFGKQIVKIQVTNRNGDLLSPEKSVLRAAILCIPYFLNGLPVTQESTWLSAVLVMIILGAGGAIIYLYIFNRSTRQSLHDLILGTYVTKAPPQKIPEAKPLWKGHKIALACWAILLVGLMFAGNKLAHSEWFEGLLELQEEIMTHEDVGYASVVENTSHFYGSGGQSITRSLVIGAYLNKDVSDKEQVATEIATIILPHEKSIDKDLINIQIIRAFDIGIASSRIAMRYNYSPENWKNKVSGGLLPEIIE
ncbi:MAG: RDD family protein [Verrucomicrobiota bacterium]